MKNSITQFSLVIIAFVALTLLMSYAKPAADEPKQYVTISASGPTSAAKMKEAFEKNVNDKLVEGWRLQGGVSYANGVFMQAMVK